CPYCLITIIVCDVEVIHNRHAAREITMRLHIHIVLAPLGSDTRVEGNTHGHWIWQRNTVFPGLDLVSFARTAIALDSKPGKIGFKSVDVCDMAITKDGLRSRDLPADELNRKYTKQDNTSSFGI